MSEPATQRQVVARAKTARRTGRWPAWERTTVSCPSMGWLGEVTHAFHNGVFAVLCREVATPMGPVVHAAIRDASNSRDITWAEKQRIKDECFGEGRTAVEVFPSAADLVDGADMYHLWILPEGQSLPFGIHTIGAET